MGQYSPERNKEICTGKSSSLIHLQEIQIKTIVRITGSHQQLYLFDTLCLKGKHLFRQCIGFMQILFEII